MFVYETYATFFYLDYRISFLRTRLSWTRTSFSEFVCRDTNCCRYVEGKLLQILTYARVGLCKIGAGNNTGPMVRLHLWKEWNTHRDCGRRFVDSSLDVAFHVRSRSCLLWKFVLSFQKKLFWLSKSSNGGFPRNPLSN
jgi:hypothetical protein